MAVTRTPKIENPNVVKVDTGHGQFLHFTIDAVGPVPIFTFASSVKGVLYEATDFPGHPKTKYVRPTRKEADSQPVSRAISRSPIQRGERLQSD